MVEERTPAIPSVRGIDLSRLWSILALSPGVLVLPVATAFACLVAWQAIAVYGDISPTILPPPTMVLQQLVLNFWLILKHTIPTTYETLLAFGISIPLGIMLAGLIVYSRLAYQALYPNIVFFQLIPKIALAPLFIVWLGIALPRESHSQSLFRSSPSWLPPPPDCDQWRQPCCGFAAPCACRSGKFS